MAIEELKKAKHLLDSGDPDGAWDIIDGILTNDPNDPRALLAASHIYEKARRLSLAYQCAERAARLAPNISECWLNFGRAADSLWRHEEAERAYEKALETAKKPEQKLNVMGNIAGLYVAAGRWKDAEKVSREALAMNPNFEKAKCNLGISLLAQKQWVEGWKNYSTYMGTSHRKLVRYGNEGEWDGSKGKSIVITGEQGLGDEISFASMIPEAVADSKKVIIDCDKRLKGLFQMSFPSTRVYGTRFVSAEDVQPSDLWKPEDRVFDASVSMGELGKFYRKQDSDFTGAPYLKADPDRVTMWKALFSAQRKPAIGIAWTGGMQWTASKLRKWDLPGLLPLFCSVDAHWVSLQYKDAQREIDEFHDKQEAARIVQYPYGTLTKDYDDTAALVASLDLVICMQTAVAHLAGALGKECWVFVPRISQWRYGSEGESIPWYKSVKVFRQSQDGSWPLGEAKRVLQLRYGNLKVAA